MELPRDDQSLVAEAVYAVSTTMDARHFAEEFMRRRKQAEKGVVEKLPPVAASGSDGKAGGGWSEVAKKGGNPAKEESVPAGFKVVPNRKKGKK
jgi:PERQ amino acid-rich with GYF domain-containing protein